MPSDLSATSNETHPRPRVVLTIAGFDPSSGAGITADLQVFAAHGLFATSCITALTVQSTLGVRMVEPVAHLIGPTLAELEQDLPPCGIKIGMLGSIEAVAAVVDYLRARPGPPVPVVLDPVLKSSSGAILLEADGVRMLRNDLLPLVGWVTPNSAELHLLTGLPTRTAEARNAAMHTLSESLSTLNIVATGGDADGSPEDLLLTADGVLTSFRGERVETTSTHGTGCAFSSALLARLASGYSSKEAVGAAKAYVAEALRRAPGLGKGHGPMHLLWPLDGQQS